MSFITKRERVFSEFSNPVNLPARNEGKLKAYSSCTDTRAWSHYMSDKTEHLIEIIKRNNEVCPGKYVPVGVIVEMMLAAKTAEISRLKRKVGQLEQMLSTYDQLELSCEQKCEISTAHAMIRAANKSLEDLPPLDLDVSGITEISDSEGFLTGQSGGDDGYSARHALKFRDSKGSMKGSTMGSIKCSKECKSDLVHSYVSTTDLSARGRSDVSTSVHDYRVETMKEALISKDAKLNALQNTIAVMENDVCEPYCIYAHIYTALEKIYATLSQNEKYKLFLNLMSAGRDTRCLDIKGKILFKLKILEKFSIALLAPCSERFKYDESCACYYSNVPTTHVETTFALTSAETNKPPDTKRTQLIADIMDHDEMKELLDRNSNTDKPEELPEDVFVSDTFSSIDNDNLCRLKYLQQNYDELMVCYENLKHERDSLRKRCKKYEEMEVEFEDLKLKLREYNTLYNERNYYRNRSEDLDSLKEQFLVLRDETAGLETQLKAEAEINSIKSSRIDDLRSSNIGLEQRLNEATVAFEKEKNTILCKLKEAECKIMCQEQQIKSLAAQVDRLLEQDPGKCPEHLPHAAYVMDEIDDLKSQVKNLNDALYSSEDEKQQLQNQFEANLQLINELRMEIENWKSEYEKARQRNEYLEKYSDGLKGDIEQLSEEVDEKNAAVANLMDVIHNKSQEVNRLMNNVEAATETNQNLTKYVQDLKTKYGSNLQELECEKNHVLDSLELAKKESQELLDKVKDYDEVLRMKEDINKKLTEQTESCTTLKSLYANAVEENKKLLLDITNQDNNTSMLMCEIQRLRSLNNSVTDEFKVLENERDSLRQSYDLKKRESEDLEDRFNEFRKLQDQFLDLSRAHDKLIGEKMNLEKDLQDKAREIDDAINTVDLTKKQSQTLLEKLERSENLKEDMLSLSKDYQKISNEKQLLQMDLRRKNEEIDNLANALANLKNQNNDLLKTSQRCYDLETEFAELKKSFEELSNEKALLQKNFDKKSQEMIDLYNMLEQKVEENRSLIEQVRNLERNDSEASLNLARLKDVNENTQSMLLSLRKESIELLSKLKNHETLLKEHEELKLHSDGIRKENSKLLASLAKLDNEKQTLLNQRGDMILQNEKLEQELIDARKELIRMQSQIPYAELKKEIEILKKEKRDNNIKIKELLEKVDEMDNTISNLSEELVAKDDKIVVLQNHINCLEDEVRHLHQTLADVLDTGEQLNENSMKKIDKSLHMMEAHHSKAAHNMKMEIAKLQNQNLKLEEQLSITKVKSNESFQNTHKYASKIIHLENEWEIIVTDIKQLEFSCVGDSKLSPTHCAVEDVLQSLDNIRRSIEARNSKSSNLEHTLLKVQTSSQLLVSKADEAKTLLEKEKQKIISEKEQAITEKLKMEQELLNLKLQLEEQTLHDKKIICDLEAELLNQKLIIDKLNQKTQSYISNLEEELKSFKNLYESSKERINKLEDKTRLCKEEKDKMNDYIKKIQANLEAKSKEISKLQNDLQNLKRNPRIDRDIQVGNSGRMKDAISQTDKYLVQLNQHNQNSGRIKDAISQTDKYLVQLNQHNQLDETNDISAKEEDNDIITSEIINRQKDTKLPFQQNKRPLGAMGNETLNEMQILAANVNPDFDYVRNSYIDYKRKQLQTGKLETVSISNTAGDKDDDTTLAAAGSSRHENFNFEYLFNNSPNEATYSNMLHGQNYTNNATSRNIDFSQRTSETEPYKSKETELFLIFKESESSHADEKSNKDKGISSKQPPILVETIAVKPDATYLQQRKNSSSAYKERSANQPALFRYPVEPGTEKLQLDITIPRVCELPSEALVETNNSESCLTFTNVNQDHKSFKMETSDHYLTRVEADVFLIKDADEDDKYSRQPQGKKLSQDFGLEYLLYSVQDYDPQSLRKTRSDSLNSQLKYYDSINEKEIMPCTSETCKHYKSDKLKDQSIEVNMDAPEDYEQRIQSLTQQQQNTEKDYKKKLEAIKVQYDNNIKAIINDHNQGVNSMQELHEETLQDIFKMHENEVENLRTMSIEAMRRAEKLLKENKMLHQKLQDCSCLDEEPIRISSEIKKHRSRRHSDMKMLSKTKIEAFNVKPKTKQYGPCTCSLEVNVSDTIRNIFEQVDVEQRKLAERAYMRFIANKLLDGNIESLDVHELSFLHLKVCRTWKIKISKDEVQQKKMDSLESQVLIRERSRQQHIADLDRDLVEQRRRLSEARNAVCRCSQPESNDHSKCLCPRSSAECRNPECARSPESSSPLPPSEIAEYPNIPISAHTAFLLARAAACSGETNEQYSLSERRSAGDLRPDYFESNYMQMNRPRRRAPVTRQDAEERRNKKMCDELPTRLRRAQDTARSSRRC